jgi:hypothetical protein
MELQICRAFFHALTISIQVKTFYSCQDWLLEHGIRFHQTLDGRWVLDEKDKKSA